MIFFIKTYLLKYITTSNDDTEKLKKKLDEVLIASLSGVHTL